MIKKIIYNNLINYNNNKIIHQQLTIITMIVITAERKKETKTITSTSIKTATTKTNTKTTTPPLPPREN